VNEKIVQGMSVAEMAEMGEWGDKRNEYIRGSVGVASIMDKMRENRHWSCYEERSVGISKNGYGIECGRKKREEEVGEYDRGRDMRTAGVLRVQDVGDRGRMDGRWPTPNRRDKKGEGDDDVYGTNC